MGVVAEILPVQSERRSRLRDLEGVIARGWDHVVEVGRALREIRDDGLYLELGEGLTFEQYVKSRWALNRPEAYRKIDAAEIDDAVSPMGDIIPITSERVGRELAPLLRQGGKERVAEAWAKIATRYEGERPPTAKEVHEALVEEGYRERTIGPSSGKTNRSIRLGMVGDKILVAEKRLEWFIDRELEDRPLTKRDREKARLYAATCAAMAENLQALADGKVVE